MFSKRKSYNPKRRIADEVFEDDLEMLSGKVRYGGNPEHKRNPGDFGLTPPASPRPDKTLCDGANVTKRAEALSLLREGVRRGMISKQFRNHFPQNVWAVVNVGEQPVAVEAQLENAENGTYHGYPMAKNDPFRDVVFSKWNSLDE